MHKNILFIGDSIIEGNTGVNFINYIKMRFQDYNIENYGLGGDTLKGITTRLLNVLEACNDYDYIILEAGHNDLLIPYFDEKSLPFRVMASMLRERGSIPTPNPEEFARLLDAKLQSIKNKYSGEIIITTLSCLGENLKSNLNMQRNLINSKIGDIGKKNGCTIVDIGKAFDDVLYTKETSDYCLEGFTKLEFFDPIYSKNEDVANKISERRGLHLTIDGVHINGKGAHIYANEIMKYIK